MTDRAPVEPIDGIVVVELALDDRHEIGDVVACLRAGAASWEVTPIADAVDGMSRAKRVMHVYDVAAEIEAEAARVREAQQAAFRAAAKAAEKASR